MSNSIKNGGVETYNVADVKDWYESDPLFDDFHLKLQPQKFYGCLWAETKGKQRLSKKIHIEVCGYEELAITGATSESYTLDYRSKDKTFDGYSFKSTGISSSKSKIQVKDLSGTSCRISSRSVSPNTDTADYKIESTETVITVKTETQGYTTSFNI